MVSSTQLMVATALVGFAMATRALAQEPTGDIIEAKEHHHHDDHHHHDHHDYHHHHHAHPYHFDYHVHAHDHYKQEVHFGQEEHSDGKVVSGKYQVLLPDGRTQVRNVAIL